MYYKHNFQLNVMKQLLVFLLLFIGFANVYSQTETPKTDVREGVQRARIRNGTKSGELTRAERVRLKAEQRNIKRTERRVKADGIVTPNEQAKLNRKQNRASRDIRRAKRNKKVAN